MITFEEAENIISKIDYNLDTEYYAIIDCEGKILAEDVFSDMDMPPFDKSAVDGYACRKEDIKNELTVIEIIQAGSIPQKEIGKNQCSQIMTGAPIPKNADAVLMVEDIEKIENNSIKYKHDFVKNNICYLGEDIKKNQQVLKKGTLISPQHIAVMAAVGYVKIKVAKTPIVGIISTGNEIIEPFAKPENSQIRNSNSYQLISQIKKIRATPNYFGIVEDTEEKTRAAIENAIKKCDILILTGGVSMGEYDFVPKVLEEIGFNIHFHKIAIKPGKPTLFAGFGNKFCFGLPGNPVSSFMLFELLVKPFIYKLQGYNYKEKILKFKLAKEFQRKRTERKEFVPITIDKENNVKVIEYHGSAHINSLIGADGVMEIEIGKSKLNARELVNIRLI